ncbi:hypothetical protein JM79_2764 [Gramella sp. Hel_I_59]|uniref:hypothetical protein n=1 Tax=Gramella sp. Hel_I_59 TaxID=1249978 RepID=UPI00114FA7D8|nr:hypothetical protein [Gramella sp. Hel_I_59]TQI71815.1 hypothetical protein JM79_2764 [Gramella sp. Hel_I_59]
MMIIRSKQPLLFEALEGKSGIISPEIQSIKKNLKTGGYEIEVHDRLQIARENPLPSEPLYSYIFLQKRVKNYSATEISNLFTIFGETIDPADNDFDQKAWNKLPEMLLFMSNTTSIYVSDKKTASEILNGVEGAFEMIDETQEVAQ